MPVLTYVGSAYDIEVFTGAKAFVMILVGSIPPLKPLWDRFMGKQMGSTMGGRIPLKIVDIVVAPRTSTAPIS